MENEERKICLITGFNSGLGLDVAVKFTELDYNLILVGRDNEKSDWAIRTIKKYTSENKIHKYDCDLSSLKEINRMISKIKKRFFKIDILINNAGVATKEYLRTPDALEYTLAVNYFAPFYISSLLKPLLDESDDARIINVSSELYKRGEVDFDNHYHGRKYKGVKAYSNSKFMLNLFTMEFAKLVDRNKLTINAYHPGLLDTNIFRHYPSWLRIFMKFFFRPVYEASNDIYNIATRPTFQGVNGKYINKGIIEDFDEKLYAEGLSKDVYKKTNEILHKNNFQL